MIMEK